MSLAFLKNILFPRSRGPVKVGATPKGSCSGNGHVMEQLGIFEPPELNHNPRGKMLIGIIERDSKPSSLLSAGTAVDLESGQCNSCKPRINSKEQKPKQRSFRPTPRMISDAIIGLSDGLTVPFALTAGLSVLGNARLVTLGGLAELMAGAISMGLGGFIGAKSEA